MKSLAELCIRRPVFATVLILSLVVVGLFAYVKLGVDRFPKVDLPTITVTTRLVGASPEEMETEITDKIEEAVNTVSGMDQLISTSSEGTSVVIASFDLEKNGDIASQEVRDRINSVLAQLPKEADPPIIEKIDPDAQPILLIALSGPAPIRDITEFADKSLKRQIESINGVGQAKLVGGRPRQINVITDSTKLSGVGLTVADVVRALQTQNVQIPGGQVEQGIRDLTLRTYGRVGTPAEFGDIPVAQKNGYAVKLRDVAQVEDGQAEAETLASVDGKPAVILQVRKQSGTNTIEVINRLKERIEQLRSQLPKGWKMDIARDESEYITAAVDAVKEHLLLGSLLAAATVLLFLRRFRLTIIAAVAIPTSLIATFAAMQYMGFTLNVITLLALALVVGIVIDDAVVVLENVFRFLEEKKLSPREAAAQGTGEIALAVLATSLSLIAVFLPVAFMGGIVGRFMNSFGVTMAFAIAVSLLVSFTLTPMMCSRWLKPQDAGTANAGHASTREKGFYATIERGYLWLLDGSMAHRWIVVLALIIVFVCARPPVHAGEQELPAGGRRIAVRGHPEDPRGFEPRSDPDGRRVDRPARPSVQGGRGDGFDRGQRSPAHPEPGLGLRQARPGRQAQGRPVRGHGPHPAAGAAGLRALESAHPGGAGLGDRRRQQRRDPVLGRRPRFRPARQVLGEAPGRFEVGARGRRRRLEPDRRPARAGSASTAPRRPTSGSTCRTSPRPSTSWSAARR